MSVNDELIQPTSDSFWEIDSYKRTTKRQDDGNRLCNDLVTFIQERADIEKHYAKSLKQWAKRWHEAIEKGPEYGTTEGAWKGILSESERVAELHLHVKDKLINEVQVSVKQWKAENYHKSVMGPCKETKELEDAFRKAQKPWAKRLAKVQKAKKDHHLACKVEKTASVQENNAKADSSMSPDQLKKIADKADKSRREVESTKDKYEAALNDINSFNSRYIEDMTEVFNQSQEFEEKRLKFFKEMMFGIHKCLDLSVDPEYPQIYTNLHATIDNADYSKDLRWWSQNNGVDMPMNWPQFEEYAPELHSITRKEKKGAVSGGGGGGDGGITLTSHVQKTEAYTPATTTPQTYTESAPTQAYDNPATTANTTPPVTSNTAPLQRQFSYDPHLNPFADDSDPEDDDLFYECDRTDTGSLGSSIGCRQRTGSSSSEKELLNSRNKSNLLKNKTAPPAPPTAKPLIKASHKQKPRNPSYDPTLNPFDDEDEDEDNAKLLPDNRVSSSFRKSPSPKPKSKGKTADHNGGQTNQNNQNPFGDDDWDDYDNAMIDDGAPGVPVRALYDYDGAEEDELTFKVGDVFEKLRDRDDQGWCKGRKGGQVGLYPDNYVEIIG